MHGTCVDGWYVKMLSNPEHVETACKVRYIVGQAGHVYAVGM
jgi:hypothetical protein